MTNSDIIAIVAIVVSGIISLATLIASYYTNRTNNKAKLTEMAFDKRLDALKYIYAATCKHKDGMVDFTLDAIQGRRTDFTKDLERYAKIVDDFESVYNANRVFIPKHIEAV